MKCHHKYCPHDRCKYDADDYAQIMFMAVGIAVAVAVAWCFS